MRKGRRLAIDVGKVRVGLSISDQDGILATPFATVNRTSDSMEQSVDDICAQIIDFSFIEFYVGLPIGLAGNPTASTEDAVLFGQALADALELPARYIDERLTTVSAASNLRLAGKTSKTSRSIIDQEAATIILETALQQEKQLGVSPGRSYQELVEAGVVSS